MEKSECKSGMNIKKMHPFIFPRGMGKRVVFQEWQMWWFWVPEFIPSHKKCLQEKKNAIFGWLMGALSGIWLVCGWCDWFVSSLWVVWTIYGWFGWFVDGLGGLWGVGGGGSSFTANDEVLIPKKIFQLKKFTIPGTKQSFKRIIVLEDSMLKTVNGLEMSNKVINCKKNQY